MRLPPAFPHSRHEQYLFALPDELLSSAEVVTRALIHIRLRYYLRGLVLPLVAEAVAQGLTVEEWAHEFVAALYGRTPTAFHR